MARKNRSSGAILAAAEQHSLRAPRGAQARMADMLRRSLIDRTTKKKSPKGGFFFCVHFTPQSRLRLDGRSVSGLLLFTSTPQSIAKPSPGWNKVALLTAVRNSPCSCPFSVSLHPPLAALNSEPRPGRLLALFSFYFIIIGLSVRSSM